MEWIANQDVLEIAGMYPLAAKDYPFARGNNSSAAITPNHPRSPDVGNDFREQNVTWLDDLLYRAD
jgi:hypothetical protein